MHLNAIQEDFESFDSESVSDGQMKRGSMLDNGNQRSGSVNLSTAE